MQEKYSPINFLFGKTGNILNLYDDNKIKRACITLNATEDSKIN